MEPEGFGLATVDPKEKKYAELKMSGYIKLREKDMYALRLRIPMGNLLADQMPRVAEVARKYGRGYVGLTVRQGVEIPWIHFRDLEKARAELEEAGIILSGCGPRVRAVVSCKGTICPYGIIDTHAIGMRIDERFFSPRVLPHKYKIGIAGCPNSCSKPQFNDLGLMGQVEPRLEESLCNGCSLCEVNCADAAITMSGDLPVRDPQKCVYCGDCIRVCPTDAWVQRAVGVAVFAGGKFGRHPRWGYRVAELVPLERVEEVIEKSMQFYVDQGRKGERLIQTIDRVGVDAFRDAVIGQSMG